MIPTQSYRIAIHSDIFKQFPEAKIACSLIKVPVKNGRNTKGAEAKYLSEYKQKVAKLVMERGVTPENYMEIPVCRSWQKVYSSFNAGDKKSTIENLIGRAVREQGKLQAGKSADLGKISNFVDLYNCVSLEEMTPMGALDASKIQGQITLRMGQTGEVFKGLGREVVIEQVTPDHVVYADEVKILTWLWNHRDAAEACVPNQSETGQYTYILLFADQAEGFEGELSPEKRPGSAEAAILNANSRVVNIGGTVIETKFLSIDYPEVEIMHESEVEIMHEVVDK